MDLSQLAPWQRLGILRLHEKWRRSANVTQTDVAKATGVQRQHLNEMEQGKRDVTPEAAEALAAYYGVEVGVITGAVDLPGPVAAELIRAAARLEEEAIRLRGAAISGGESEAANRRAKRKKGEGGKRSA